MAKRPFVVGVLTMTILLNGLGKISMVSHLLPIWNLISFRISGIINLAYNYFEERFFIQLMCFHYFSAELVETTMTTNHTPPPPLQQLRILTAPHTIYAEVDSSVELPCVLEEPDVGSLAQLPIRRGWTHNFFPLAGSPRLTLDSGNYALTLMNVTEEDAGHYTCSASSGRSKAQITLEVIIGRE